MLAVCDACDTSRIIKSALRHCGLRNRVWTGARRGRGMLPIRRWCAARTLCLGSRRSWRREGALNLQHRTNNEDGGRKEQDRTVFGFRQGGVRFIPAPGQAKNGENAPGRMREPKEVLGKPDPRSWIHIVGRAAHVHVASHGKGGLTQAPGPCVLGTGTASRAALRYSSKVASRRSWRKLSNASTPRPACACCNAAI